MESPETPPQPADVAQRSNRSAMLIVFLVVFIDLLGFGIILPLLPRIAEGYVERMAPRATWQVGLVVGLLMSSFSLMQFLFAPIWGRLSDRAGRRPILLLGLGGSVVFYALFGWATSLDPTESAALALAFFFVARIGAGIAGATIATAQAVIADSTPPDKRKHGMALIGAAFGIGFTFGPLIGFGSLWLTGNYLPVIGYTASVLSAVALVLGIILLPETRIFNHDSTARRRLLDWSAIRATLADRGIGPVILTFFIASLGFGAFEVTLALFLKDTFGLGEDGSFLIFAFIGFVLMLTQGVLYRRLASRVSEATFMAIGVLFMAIGVALLGGINHFSARAYQQDVVPMVITSTVGVLSGGQGPWIAAPGLYVVHQPSGVFTAALYLALIAAVVGFAFLTPSAQALISRRTSSDRQGEILGVNQSASALARILGPILGVTLYKATDTHLLPYIAGAVLLFLMVPLFPRIRRGS